MMMMMMMQLANGKRRNHEWRIHYTIYHWYSLGHITPLSTEANYVMAKIVTSDGDCENVFLGLAEPDERGASGYTGAIMSVASIIVDCEELFPKVTSIVTDGASINVGEKNGMWTEL